ncbi:Hypothetical_protein [Hexamita inflata]|uniref:Hypothetical_protein n=1 Tax=Hexamita inflata TaxID=28002 RepID=A0AA86NMP5_9EUKA|nr:Hypothetical protein HINF_LOCUS10029 [Hexamita inflata]
MQLFNYQLFQTRGIAFVGYRQFLINQNKDHTNLRVSISFLSQTGTLYSFGVEVDGPDGFGRNFFIYDYNIAYIMIMNTYIERKYHNLIFSSEISTNQIVQPYQSTNFYSFSN